MKLITATLLFTLALTSCAQKMTNKTVTIDPHLSFQNYEHFKRLTLKSPDSRIEYLNGFDFAWGYSYKLSVKETKLAETLSDGTQFEYKLIKVLSKTKVPDSTEFELFLDPNRYYYEVDSSEQQMNITFNPINDSTFLYMEEVEIEVPSEFKDQFDTIVSGGVRKLGTFVYIDDKRIRLVRL